MVESNVAYSLTSFSQHQIVMLRNLGMEQLQLGFDCSAVLQQLKDENESLRAENSALKSQLEALKNRLSASPTLTPTTKKTTTKKRLHADMVDDGCGVADTHREDGDGGKRNKRQRKAPNTRLSLSCNGDDDGKGTNAHSHSVLLTPTKLAQLASTDPPLALTLEEDQKSETSTASTVECISDGSAVENDDTAFLMYHTSYKHNNDENETTLDKRDGKKNNKKNNTNSELATHKKRKMMLKALQQHRKQNQIQTKEVRTSNQANI